MNHELQCTHFVLNFVFLSATLVEILYFVFLSFVLLYVLTFPDNVAFLVLSFRCKDV